MKSLLPIAEKIATRLIERRETIAIAESSTGGLIAGSGHEALGEVDEILVPESGHQRSHDDKSTLAHAGTCFLNELFHSTQP